MKTIIIIEGDKGTIEFLMPDGLTTGPVEYPKEELLQMIAETAAKPKVA